MVVLLVLNPGELITTVGSIETSGSSTPKEKALMNSDIQNFTYDFRGS